MLELRLKKAAASKQGKSGDSTAVTAPVGSSSARPVAKASSGTTIKIPAQVARSSASRSASRAPGGAKNPNDMSVEELRAYVAQKQQEEETKGKGKLPEVATLAESGPEEEEGEGEEGEGNEEEEEEDQTDQLDPSPPATRTRGTKGRGKKQ